MSDSRPPYHRRSTKPIPRIVSEKRPASATALEQDRIETIVPCVWCEGHGMTTADERAEWRATYPEVADKEPVIP